MRKEINHLKLCGCVR